jgi:uncharacterized protein YcgL (UPF0745 family)
VRIILAMAMPPVVIPMVLSPVLVMLVSVEMESHLVKVTIACTKSCYSSTTFFQILMNVPEILAMAMPPVVIPMVLSPVLVMLVSVEMESHLVKVTIACTKSCYSSTTFFQILMNVPEILAMATPPVVTPLVLSPVLVMLVSVEMESHPV